MSDFERTMLPHLDAAYNLARWIVRNDAAAQDVVQEAFLRALRFHEQRRGDEPLPWLLRIVRNTAFTWLEKQHRHDHCEPLPDEALEDPAAIDPAAALALETDCDALNHAVESLAPEFREVIVLRELQGLSYKNIAQVTGISIGTVMSRLSRARQKLQWALAPAMQEEADGM